MLSNRLTRRSLQAVERLRFQHPAVAGGINASWPNSFSVRCFANDGSDKPLPPRSELNNWYERHYGQPLSNDTAFEFEDHFHDGKIWWTAKLTCPMTKKIYTSAPLPEEKLEVWNQFLWSKAKHRVPIEVDNKFYFQKLKTAMHAAAEERLRAIEAEGGEAAATRIVVEDDTVMDTTGISDNSGSVASTPQPEEQAETPTSEQVTIPNVSQASITSPKNVLDNYYVKVQSTPVGSDAMETTYHRERGTHMTSWWSSSFNCPVSGLRYASGSLRDEGTYGEVRYLDGEPYYARAKSSLQAASARAIDHIVFQKTGVLEPRLCHEDPSTFDSVFVHPDIESRRLKKSSSKTEESIGVTVFEEVETDTAQVDEEIELTLQAVSTAGTSTLGRLMEAWSDTVEESLLDTSTAESIVPLTRTSTQQSRALVSHAKTWLKSIQPSRPTRGAYVTFHNPLQVSTLDSCNSILTVLGKANNGISVQDVADEVLDFLWSDAKPNVDSYNAYIQCLSGEPEEVARKAQEIFADMVSGRKVAGKKMPAPNVELFNTVLRLWARTGKPSKCQEILDLLKSAGLEANSETYLDLLSSLAYGTFDQKRATDWIEAMENDGLLCQDAYDAPLRWAGKKVGAHVIPWDDYEYIFEDGFVEEPQIPDLLEAEAVEAWILNLEQMEGFDVTLGCYEALMQAWLRTGTREGFERATSVAKALRYSEGSFLQPTPQTFLPILAACSHCGEQDVFQLWKGSVRGFMRETYPQLPVDNRAFAMHVLTYRRYQDLLASVDGGSLLNSKEATSKAIGVLKHTCSLFNSPKARSKAFVQFGQFHDTLSCCRNLSLHLAATGNKDEARAAAKSIIDIISIFDAAVKNIHGAIHEMDEEDEAALEMDQGGDFDDESDTSLSSLDLQLQHLLHASTSVYHHALSCLDEIDQACAGQNDQPLQMEYLPEIESMLRSSAKHHQLLSTYAYTSGALEISFADGFTYQSDPPRASYLDLCSKIMESFQKPNAAPVRSDEVRVVMLMLDSVFDSKRGKSDIIQLSSICLDMIAVFKSMQVAEEKKAVLHHFLKILSGKAETSIGTLDINSIVRAAKGYLVEEGELSVKEGGIRARSLRGRKKRSSGSSA